MKDLFRSWGFRREGGRVLPSGPAPDWRALYRTLLQARCLDEAEADLIARGEAFFHVSGAGHEGSAVLQAFLRPDDYLHLHYRDKALMLARGVKPAQFLHSLLGNAESHSLGRQMSAHMSDPRLHILSIVAPVGNNALQAAGVAAELKARNRQAIVVCSMGDGTSQQGEVHEAIAEAVRASLPVLFFIEDNHYAISTRTRGQTFYSRPDGEASEYYGLPIHRVDGRDPVAAHAQLGPIVAAVRSEGRPALVVFGVERLCHHTNADDQSRYRPPAEIAAASASGDPIRHLARHLAQQGVTAEELEQMERQVRGEIAAATATALATWTAPPAVSAKLPLPAALVGDAEAGPEEPAAGHGAGEGRFTMLEAMREVLRRQLAADERVTLLGEDIEDPKGDVFGITRGLSEAFPGRVANSPLSESTIAGLSIGRALAGGRPVALIQFADFLPLAFNQILSELATLHWRTAGGWKCPVILLAPCGGYRPGLGPFHAQTMESVLAHAPGLDVFMPSNAVDAAGLLNAAFLSRRPTVLLYPKVCLNVREDLAPAAAIECALPIGRARFLSRGSDLTLVTWGATVPLCTRVVQTLRTARVSVDLIDLRSISPWDRDAVCASAERTGTLVVVHEDNLTAGFGAEVVAGVMESVPKRIAVRRITRPDTYVPCRFANQLEVLPSFKRILSEISSLLDLDLNWVTPAGAQATHEYVNAIGSSPADRMVTIVSWRVKAGDPIHAGDLIAEVESDKAVAELACPTSGIVDELLAAPGVGVPVGQPILKVRPDRPGARITPTVVLQRGEPVVQRRESRPAPPRAVPAPVPSGARTPIRSPRGGVGLSGIATAEGSKLITNEQLAARFPQRTADEIFRLTGIETRRHLAEGESLLDLAAVAARRVLESEGLTLSDLDAIVCSTTTPEEITPSLACALQTRLGTNGISTRLAAYDLLAACSGFLYALSTAFDFLQTRPQGRVLVVTAEALSRVVNPHDFDTAILFGDAATAVVLHGAVHASRARMLLHPPVIGAKADPEGLLRVANPGVGFVEMQGRKVFGEAVRTMVEALAEACDKHGLQMQDLSHIVPHQANGRILDAVRVRLGDAGSRLVHQVRHRGNTSSCSIPLCLAGLAEELKPGARVGLCAFGGGLTYGAAILAVNPEPAPAGFPAITRGAQRSGSFAIAPENVIPNTVVVDVTDQPEWMERARWLTAEAYVALADPKHPLGLEDAYDVVSADAYERPGRSRTVVALTTDPASGCTKISGTLRLVWGSPENAPPADPVIDAMSLLEPVHGWPHRQRDWVDSAMAELGRFFIPDRYRTLSMRRAGVDVWLSQQLLQAVSRIASSKSVKMFYIIMPAYVTRLIPGVPIEEVEVRLRTEDPQVAAIFRQYRLYWERARPKLYYHLLEPSSPPSR